jgi:hypothetical protein
MFYFNQVRAIGRDTYIRIYPNPGIGVQISPTRRIALSWRRGWEVSHKNKAGGWDITYRRLNRVLQKVG